jgi:P27 family predicted phage terminase small subunit
MRGRKPTPTHRKKLAGNPGKRPLNDQEPVLPDPRDAFDIPPAELQGEGLATAEWVRLAPMLREARQVTDGERAVLIALCQQWGRYLEANEKVSMAGLIVKAPSGYPMINPYLTVANKALQHCTKLWAELGLTPTSRGRIVAVPPRSMTDPFAEFDLPVS